MPIVQDDWRISPELTLKPGVRWEYSTPITELYGRLVNLDIAPGFSRSGSATIPSVRRRALSGFAGPSR